MNIRTLDEKTDGCPHTEVFKTYMSTNWEKHNLLREMRTIEPAGEETDDETPNDDNDDSNDTGYNYDGDDDLVNEDGTETGLLQKVL